MGWTPNPLIDPHLGLSRGERRAVRRGAWGRWFNQPGRKRSLGILGAFTVLFLVGLTGPLLDGRRWYLTLMALVLYVAAVAVLVMVLRRLGFARCVYAELRARGHDVCLRCGYHLVDLPDDHDRCPECGARR